MLFTLAIVLFVLWALGAFAFHDVEVVRPLDSDRAQAAVHLRPIGCVVGQADDRDLLAVPVGKPGRGRQRERERRHL